MPMKVEEQILEVHTWSPPHYLVYRPGIDVFAGGPQRHIANNPMGNYREDAQTDLDLWFDYKYVYTYTQAEFLIIWFLSAFFLISKYVFVIITKILAYRIDKQAKSNVSIDFKNLTEISKFNRVNQKSKQVSSILA